MSESYAYPVTEKGKTVLYCDSAEGRVPMVQPSIPLTAHWDTSEPERLAKPAYISSLNEMNDLWRMGITSSTTLWLIIQALCSVHSLKGPHRQATEWWLTLIDLLMLVSCELRRKAWPEQARLCHLCISVCRKIIWIFAHFKQLFKIFLYLWNTIYHNKECGYSTINIINLP